MPKLLEGAVKYTVESNTPVPYQLCQCSICRKVGGYTGTVNIMGNTKSLKIVKGEDKIKKYQAVMTFDKSDKPVKKGNSKRSFCGECSSMLWLYDDDWPDWVYPFAASIDTELEAVPKGKGVTVMRSSCPSYVPIPAGWTSYDKYAPGEGIEAWHKENGLWVE